jgi:hypothetical protein
VETYEPRAYLREATLRAVRNPGTVTLARDLESQKPEMNQAIDPVRPISRERARAYVVSASEPQCGLGSPSDPICSHVERLLSNPRPDEPVAATPKENLRILANGPFSDVQEECVTAHSPSRFLAASRARMCQRTLSSHGPGAGEVHTQAGI